MLYTSKLKKSNIKTAFRQSFVLRMKQNLSRSRRSTAHQSMKTAHGKPTTSLKWIPVKLKKIASRERKLRLHWCAVKYQLQVIIEKLLGERRRNFCSYVRLLVDSHFCK